MRLSIQHQTRFDYAAPASYALLQLRLHPRTGPTQEVLDWSLSLDGAVRHATFRDAFGSHVDLIELSPDARQVDIHVAGEVETRAGSGIVGPGVVGSGASCVPLWHYRRETALTRADADISALADAAAGADRVAALHALSRDILAAVPYTSGTTRVGTTAAQALSGSAGVCQDHTHIFLSAARRMGVPARYVSGYLMMNDRTDQEATHAWAEAHLDGLGWVGFDVSNGISPDERYVKIAHGLDYRDCAPTRGLIIGGSEEQLEVTIQVQQ
ncbi:MAG: transglutaminase family protein [Pseudomonadota bacterium]